MELKSSIPRKVRWVGIDLDSTWADTSASEQRQAPFPIGPEIPGTRAIIDRILMAGELWLNGVLVGKGIETIKCFTARANEEVQRQLVAAWLENVGH